jgi:hypothetical protein
VTSNPTPFHIGEARDDSHVAKVFADLQLNLARARTARAAYDARLDAIFIAHDALMELAKLLPPSEMLVMRDGFDEQRFKYRLRTELRQWPATNTLLIDVTDVCENDEQGERRSWADIPEHLPVFDVLDDEGDEYDCELQRVVQWGGRKVAVYSVLKRV